MKLGTRKQLVYLLSLMTGASVLFFDLMFPLGVAGGVPYVLLVLIGLLTRQPKTIIVLAVFGSVLTMVAYYLSPAGGIPHVVLINRGLALFAIWSVAIVSYVHLTTLRTLEPLATHDQLTELYNRYYFMNELSKQIAMWHRHQTPLSLISLDIDHYKKVNDSYGHAAGDAVLRTIGVICRSIVRDIDTVARIGGEEFAILLPKTSLRGAMQIAERIREQVENYCFAWRDHEIRLTVSMGVAELTSEDWGINEYLEVADAALYKAKERGRNRSIASTS